MFVTSYKCYHIFKYNDVEINFKERTVTKNNEIVEYGDKELAKEFKKAHIYNKPKCRECWARFYCSGGCQANNFSFNGDMKIPYEIGCKMQKKRIECAIALKAV
mgnify:CR=1 FL=1